MVKPSILQTLLRKPSQTYSTPTYSEQDDFSPITSSFLSLSRSPSTSKIKSSSSSIKSLTSNTSSRSSPRKIRKSLSSNNTGFGNESGGSVWEWSSFGGRKGLTGGPASLNGMASTDDNRSSRSRGSSQVDERDLREREKSLRSYKSCETLGSGASSGRKQRNSFSGRSESGDYDRAGRNHDFESRKYGNEENYLPIASTSTLAPLITDQTPSRKYSTSTSHSNVPFPSSFTSNPDSYSYYPATNNQLPTISITASSPSPSSTMKTQYVNQQDYYASQSSNSNSSTSTTPNPKKPRPNISPLKLENTTTSNELRSPIVLKSMNTIATDEFGSVRNNDNWRSIEKIRQEQVVGEEIQDYSYIINNSNPVVILAPSPRIRKYSFLLDPVEEGIEEEEEEEEENDVFEESYSEQLVETRRSSEESARPESMYFDASPLSRHTSLRRSLDEDDDMEDFERTGRRPTSIYFDTLNRSESIQRSKRQSWQSDLGRPDSIYYDAESSGSLESEEGGYKTIVDLNAGRVYTMDDLFAALPAIPISRTPSPLPPPLPPKNNISAPPLVPTRRSPKKPVETPTSPSPSPNSPALSSLSSTTSSNGWGSGYSSPPTTSSELSRDKSDKHSIGHGRQGSECESEDDSGVAAVVGRSSSWSRAILVPRPLSTASMNGTNVFTTANNVGVVRSHSVSKAPQTHSSTSTMQIVASSSSSTKHNSVPVYSTSIPFSNTSSNLSFDSHSSPQSLPLSSSSITRSQSVGYTRLEKSQRNSGSFSNPSGYAGIGSGSSSTRHSIASFVTLPAVSEEHAYGGIVEEEASHHRNRISSSNSSLYPTPNSIPFPSSTITHSQSSNRLSQYSLDSLAITANPFSQFDSLRPPYSPPRASSVYSSTSFDGRSQSGYSTTSAPQTTAAHRPTKNPKRFVNNSAAKLPHLTVMNSISIVSNTAPVTSSGITSVFKKRSSVELNKHSSYSVFSPEAFDPKRDLTFGNSSKQPLKIKSDEILLEVLAVGLDKFDYEMTKAMSGKSEAHGFIPGRAFTGRALECGVQVTKVKRGDFVFGITDLRKSGALAERLVVNRDSLALAPNCKLSAESISALPASGIPAVLAMESLCNSLPKGSKILILNANEGTGNLCLQLAIYFRATRDLWIVAQCDPGVIDGERYCRNTGASDVILDETLSAINSLHESSVDVVIDTIGGRRIYDASRRILHFTGSFITTIGDTFDSSEKKTHMRSLRRSFFKKDLKQIDYFCIPVDGAEGRKSALETLRDAVERCGVRPTVKRVWSFEQGKEAFVDWEGEGRVVKIVQT